MPLLERIIKASSNLNNLILDPFCGGSTSLIAAERLGRKWIGIDIGDDVNKFADQRFSQLNIKVNYLRTPPSRTDGGGQQKTKKKTLKKVLYSDQSGICNLCDEYVNIKFMEIDHITPVSKGGHDYDDNKQLLCGHCNKIKGNKTMKEAEVILDRWVKEHSDIDF